MIYWLDGCEQSFGRTDVSSLYETHGSTYVELRQYSEGPW